MKYNFYRKMQIFVSNPLIFKNIKDFYAKKHDVVYIKKNVNFAISEPYHEVR